MCIGLSWVSDLCVVIIGNNVDIGFGVKLFGCIMVGDNVFIGVNFVVM